MKIQFRAKVQCVLLITAFIAFIVCAYSPHPPASETVLSDVLDLDRYISYAAVYGNDTLEVRLSNMQVWDDLADLYKDHPDVPFTHGINEIKMTHEQHEDYVEAVLRIEYEMHIRIAVAYKKGDTKELTAAETQVYNKAIDIIKNKVPENGTLLEKETAVHDYLAGNIEYDYTFSAASFTVYGALINNKAVCQGYAQAFRMLMDMLGFDCILVGGAADIGRGTENHAWNLLRIDGVWYHVDVTWNSVSNSHDYFNLSDKDIEESHKWNVANYSRLLQRNQ